MKFLAILVFSLVLSAITPALAQSTTPTATVSQSPLDRQVLDIAANLRCLVCQNQSIADSHAPLAIDLRTQIREQLEAGKSETAINQYMVERYGSFVLYSPPVQSSTWLLWFGPFALLAVGTFVAWRVMRTQSTRDVGGKATNAAPANASDLNKLLD
jgi:cytochrome c-type biogenesis protein CcmH